MKDLFGGSPEEWMSTLSRSQRKRAETLLASASTDVAVTTLIDEAMQRRFLGFKLLGKKGAPEPKEPSESIAKRLIGEFNKFACGNPDYEDERKKFGTALDKSKNTAMTTLAAALALKVGVAAGIIVPVLAVLAATVAKIGLNAYCQGKR